jgi:hypothetical protein
MSLPVVYGTTGRIAALLDGSITRDIINQRQDIGGQVVAEYVWIGGTGQDIRSKAKYASLSAFKILRMSKFSLMYSLGFG